MIATLSSLLLVLPAPTTAPTAPPEAAAAPSAPAELTVAAPRDDDVPDKRADIKELLEKLKGHVGKRGREDNEAIAVIDQLVQVFPECGPKDRASIVKGLSKNFDAKRKDLEDGVPDNKLYIATAVSLGEMGKDATKELTKWIGHKKHRKDLQLQRWLILSLGKTKDEAGVRTLVDLLENKDPLIVGAAAEAIQNYDGADLKTRKKLVEEMIKVIMSAKGAMDMDRNDTIARERYDTIAAPIITSLQALTGHDERVPEQWQRWWNKNKKKDWDKAS